MFKSENHPPLALNAKPNKPTARLVLRSTKTRLMEVSKSSANVVSLSGPPINRRALPAKARVDCPKLTRKTIIPNEPEPEPEDDVKLPIKSERLDHDTNLELRIGLAVATTSEAPPPFDIKWDSSIVSCGPLSIRSHLPTKDSLAVIPNRAIEFEGGVNKIAQLKNGDRYKPQELLETQTTVNEDTEEVPSAKSKTHVDTQKYLDPRALSFEGFVSLEAQTWAKKSDIHCLSSRLPIPRKKPHQDPLRLPPIWIKTIKSINLFHQPEQAARPSTVIRHRPGVGASASESSSLSEDGPGRTAYSIDPAWAKALLEKFSAKYPMTGKVRCAPLSTVKGRHATAIQQRLEFLLLREREKKVLESHKKQA